MRTIDWLPPEPLSVAKCLAYRRDFDHIKMCAPVLGVRPDPKQRVVLLYVGIHSTTLYTAFDPDREAWVELECGPSSEVIPRTAEVIRDAMAYVMSRYPDDTFSAMKRVDPATN